jgi:hypothetical protein
LKVENLLGVVNGLGKQKQLFRRLRQGIVPRHEYTACSDGRIIVEYCYYIGKRSGPVLKHCQGMGLF